MTPRLLALAVSDRTLVRCDLDRARTQARLDDDGLALGLGAWDDGHVVQRRFGLGVPRAQGFEVAPTDMLLAVAAPLLPGLSFEQQVQPLSSRQWLFACLGDFPASPALRNRLAAEVPDAVGTGLPGQTVAQVVFALFLAELRGHGRAEAIPAAAVARALRQVGATVDRAAAAAGHTPRLSFVLAASNSRVLAATRRGDATLSWRLLEGEGSCARHGLSGQEPDAVPLARDHRRRKAVILATEPLPGGSWVEVGPGACLGVDGGLDVVQLA